MTEVRRTGKKSGGSNPPLSAPAADLPTGCHGSKGAINRKTIRFYFPTQTSNPRNSLAGSHGGFLHSAQRSGFA